MAVFSWASTWPSPPAIVSSRQVVRSLDALVVLVGRGVDSWGLCKLGSRGCSFTCERLICFVRCLDVNFLCRHFRRNLTMISQGVRDQDNHTWQDINPRLAQGTLASDPPYHLPSFLFHSHSRMLFQCWCPKWECFDTLVCGGVGGVISLFTPFFFPLRPLSLSPYPPPLLLMTPDPALRSTFVQLIGEPLSCKKSLTLAAVLSSGHGDKTGAVHSSSVRKAVVTA